MISKPIIVAKIINIAQNLIYVSLFWKRIIEKKKAGDVINKNLRSLSVPYEGAKV
jgi:hypothetical protein